MYIYIPVRFSPTSSTGNLLHRQPPPDPQTTSTTDNLHHRQLPLQFPLQFFPQLLHTDRNFLTNFLYNFFTQIITSHTRRVLADLLAMPGEIAASAGESQRSSCLYVRNLMPQPASPGRPVSYAWQHCSHSRRVLGVIMPMCEI